MGEFLPAPSRPQSPEVMLDQDGHRHKHPKANSSCVPGAPPQTPEPRHTTKPNTAGGPRSSASTSSTRRGLEEGGGRKRKSAEQQKGSVGNCVLINLNLCSVAILRGLLRVFRCRVPHLKTGPIHLTSARRSTQGILAEKCYLGRRYHKEVNNLLNSR